MNIARNVCSVMTLPPHPHLELVEGEGVEEPDVWEHQDLVPPCAVMVLEDGAVVVEQRELVVNGNQIPVVKSRVLNVMAQRGGDQTELAEDIEAAPHAGHDGEVDDGDANVDAMEPIVVGVAVVAHFHVEDETLKLLLGDVQLREVGVAVDRQHNNRKLVGGEFEDVKAERRKVAQTRLDVLDEVLRPAGGLGRRGERMQGGGAYARAFASGTASAMLYEAFKEWRRSPSESLSFRTTAAVRSSTMTPFTFSAVEVIATSRTRENERENGQHLPHSYLFHNLSLIKDLVTAICWKLTRKGRRPPVTIAARAVSVRVKSKSKFVVTSPPMVQEGQFRASLLPTTSQTKFPTL